MAVSTTTLLVVVGVLSTESRAAPRHSLAEAEREGRWTEENPTVQQGLKKGTI